MTLQIRADADTRHKQLLDAIGGDNPIASGSDPLHLLDASGVQEFLLRERCPLTAAMCKYANGDGYFLAEAIEGMGWRHHEGQYLLGEFCGGGDDGSNNNPGVTTYGKYFHPVKKDKKTKKRTISEEDRRRSYRQSVD